MWQVLQYLALVGPDDLTFTGPTTTVEGLATSNLHVEDLIS